MIFPRLAHVNRERPAIQDNPPTIFHWRPSRAATSSLRESPRLSPQYRESLPPSDVRLLDRFEFKDIAIKVDGVGSVGTLCAGGPLMADDEDPLFLQMKEARASVLEAYAGKSAFRHQGQRVVHGHRLMQSASDIFLGWCTSKTGRHFYVRQLRDIKLKPILDAFSATDTIQFGEWCGWTLARAHARSGEPAMIGGYLGSGPRRSIKPSRLSRSPMPTKLSGTMNSSGRQRARAN